MRSNGMKTVIAIDNPKDLARIRGIWAKLNARGEHQIFGLIVGEMPGKSKYSHVFISKDILTNQITGFASVRILEQHGFKTATVDYLCVREDLKRKGIGSKLLGRINSFLITKNVSLAYLVSSQAGQDFYNKTNWKPSRFIRVEHSNKPSNDGKPNNAKPARTKPGIPGTGVDWEFSPSRKSPKRIAPRKKQKPPAFGVSPTAHARKYKSPLRIA